MKHLEEIIAQLSEFVKERVRMRSKVFEERKKTLQKDRTFCLPSGQNARS